jgi:hypothetical protein
MGGVFSLAMSISNTATHKKRTPEKTFLRSMFRDGSFIGLSATEVTETTELKKTYRLTSLPIVLSYSYYSL